MGHMLKTINPAAAENIEARMPGDPLPDIGTTCVYNCPPRQVRLGRKRITAVVTGRDDKERTLSLLLIFGVNDYVEETRVPEWNGSASRGWSLPEGSLAMVQKQVAELRHMLIGDMEAPDEPLALVVDSLIDTVNQLIPETAAAKVAVAPAPAPKRKARGRTAK